ncbi:MAG: TolC family protein [Candidatus Omnitrophica bacterium]|nr:TolC family protein [Candidatus Omnitrophota bacterium]
MKTLMKIFCFFLLLNGAILGAAQTTGEDIKEDFFHGEEFPATLESVTRLALDNNFDIQLAKYDVLISRTDLDVSESIFDAIINAELKYHNDKSQPASTLLGTKSLDKDYNLGITKKFPSGITVAADLTNNRNWSNSSFATTNPSHDVSLGVTIKQDLGKNFFGIQDRSGIALTKSDIIRSEFLSLDKIEQEISAVQKAYWDLVLQEERVRIAEDMVEQAKNLFDSNTEKAKDGFVEAPEVIAAEANYRTMVNNLILEQNQRKTRENILRLLLNISSDKVCIVPTDKMELDQADEKNERSLRRAFENRYDYQDVKEDLESKDIRIAMKKNSLWPEINLETTLARNGVDDHFNQAYQKMVDEDNLDFSIGLTLSMPIKNTEAKAELKAVDLEKAKAILSLKLIERKVAVNIIDQVRECNVLKEVAINSHEIAKLQSRKLEEEQKRFARGRSDTDTIIRFQEDAIQARALAAQASHFYYVAVIDLRREEGFLLNKYWDGKI